MTNEKKENDPLTNIVLGATGTVFGLSMALKKFRNTKKIKRLWNQNMTLKKLEDLAKQNQLPKVCIIPGTLKSNEFIKPFLFESPSLISHFNVREIVNQPILISEVLVTRLSCKIETKKDKEVRYGRNVRTNIHFARENSKNLQLESSCGNYSASLELPDTSKVLSHGDDPSLFLTVPDAKLQFSKSIEGSNYEHLSKFIYLDVETNNETEIPEIGLNSSASLNLLKEIGEKSTSKEWKWIPKTFYDGELPKWGKWLDIEMVTFKQYFERLLESAELRNQNSDKKFKRDKENGFRVVSLAIPNNEKVTIVARPSAILGKDGNISIRLLPFEGTEEDFHFRILKGHDISNLILQHKKGIKAYLSLAIASLLLFLYSFYDLLKEHSPENIKKGINWMINRIKMAIINLWRRLTGYSFGK
jgi:hypothetical protein